MWTLLKEMTNKEYNKQREFSQNKLIHYIERQLTARDNGDKLTADVPMFQEWCCMHTVYLMLVHASLFS